MRILVIAAVVLALMAASAQAQGRRQPNDGAKPIDDSPKVDEMAYNAALERIPEAKDRNDPWGGLARASRRRSRSGGRGSQRDRGGGDAIIAFAAPRWASRVVGSRNHKRVVDVKRTLVHIARTIAQRRGRRACHCARLCDNSGRKRRA